MDYLDKFKKLNTGTKVFLIGVLIILFLPNILDFTPFMQEKNAYILQEYNKVISHLPSKKVENYSLGKGILKRWVTSNIIYSGNIQAISNANKEQVELLGWRVEKDNELGYTAFIKGRLRLSIELIRENRQEETSIWALVIAYVDNFI